jgi:hypothetical protein
MIERGQARECDMVIALLQDELSSPEYSEYIQPNLERNGLTRDFIDSQFRRMSSFNIGGSE